MRNLVLLAAILGACVAKPVRDTCVPGDARPVVSWTVPEACKPRVAPTTPVAIHGETELADYLDCPAGTPLGIDFSTQALILTAQTLSPATVGVDAFDDGRTVTFVSRQRQPCASSPLPMPIQRTMAFVVSTQPRVFATSACTIPSDC